MSDKKSGNNFFQNVDKFFRRVQNQDLISLGGKGKINFANASQTKEELKLKQQMQVFRQYLQNKNWNLKHIEFFDEYRRMDSTYPIINAALRLYSQEVCLSGDCVVSTPAGDLTIKEIYDQKKTLFLVDSFHPHFNMSINAECKGIKSNGIKDVYEVTVVRNIDEETAQWDTKTEAKFKCTDNHQIMLPDKSFKQLKDLTIGDTIFAKYNYIDPSCGCKKQKFVATIITNIQFVGQEEVFDLLDVGPFHNFSLKLTDSFSVFVHNCNKDADGDIFKIISDDKNIKRSINECFYDNLKLDSKSYLYVRSMLKFGNLFGFLETRRGVGVTDIIQLPPESIRIMLLQQADRLDQFNYIWNGYGGGIEFDPWEIVHWKIIEDIEHEPYGQSILRSVVDTWRRIVLMREALIIYRITRAPQRFLFKIDTTGLDGDAALRFAEQMKKQLMKKPLVNPMTGEVDAKFTTAPIHKDSIIPLLDGRNITIEGLAKEYEEGKINYVYSISDKDNSNLPGKVVWCGKNYTANTLIKITLDDDTYILSAPEHPFILKDGSTLNADQLTPELSLMPYYTDQKKVGNSPNTYEMVYNNNSGLYEYTHRYVAKEFKDNNSKFNTVHHKDFNRYNKLTAFLKTEKGQDVLKKNGERLSSYARSEEGRQKTSKWNKLRNSAEVMQWYNHSDLHKEHNILRSIAQKNFWLDFEKRSKRIKNMTVVFDDYVFDCLKNEILKGNLKTLKSALEFINSNLIVYLESINKFFKTGKITKIILTGRVQDKGFKTYSEFRNSLLINHKIKSIEVLTEQNTDVYCMTVEGLNGEQDRHNFAVCTRKEDGSYNQSGIYIKNSVLEDFYMPTYEGDTSDVRILEGATNLDQVEDYKIIKDDLFAGLLIPKSYLAFEEDLCIRANELVLTNEGKITIKDIANIFEKNPDKKLFALSCTEFGLITHGKINWCKQTKETNILYRIHLSNGRYNDVTDNHPYLLDTMVYKRADELSINDSIKNIFDKEIYVSNIEIIELETSEFVYDLEVDNFHNFALESGIFVHNSNKAALSQEDLRFNNAVKQYQSYYIEGMLHVALVHLYMNGYSKDELESFEIQMNGSSTLAEKAKNELLQQRIDLANAALTQTIDGISLMSFTNVLRDILKFTDEEIAETFKNQMIENKLIWELKQLRDEGHVEDPDPNKKKARMKGMVDQLDVFKDLQFEASEQIPKMGEIINRKLDKEIKSLTGNRKRKPSKKMIESVVNLNESKVKRNIRKTYTDLGMKPDNEE